MFCSKCGAGISEKDRFCPQCGAENANYNEGKKLFVPLTGERKISRREETGRKIKIPIIVSCCLAVIAVVCICCSLLLKGSHSTNGKGIAYSPRGLWGYTDVNGNEYFIQNGEAVIFEGEAISGRTTPDHSKYIVLWKDETLMMYTGAQDKGAKIAETVSELSAVNDYGCFYQTTGKKQLYFYDFETGESIDTGLENTSITFSKGNKSVAGLNEKGELFIFSYGDTASKNLCNAGTDVEICAVADDGSNVIWCNEDGNFSSVYMMVNGVPERIGKISMTNEYSTVSGTFFDNDKSFIIDSSRSPELLLSVDGGEVQEIMLPGVKGYGPFLDANGNYIDSDDDSMSEFYFQVLDNEDTMEEAIYRMSRDGELKSIVSDANAMWRLNGSDYCIADGKVYYINNDSDLAAVSLEKANQTTEITTEVSDFYISCDSKYAYIVKSGSLYYCELSDSSYKLNLITNNFTNKDTLAVTDRGDTIYYINETQDVGDKYWDKGTLYCFTVGSEPRKLADNVMYIRSCDTRYVSVEQPIFIQYVSNRMDGYVANVGTVSNDKFEILINNVVY